MMSRLWALSICQNWPAGPVSLLANEIAFFETVFTEKPSPLRILFRIWLIWLDSFDWKWNSHYDGNGLAGQFWQMESSLCLWASFPGRSGRGAKRKESLQSHLKNLNLYIGKVNARCWLAQMNLVMTSVLFLFLAPPEHPKVDSLWSDTGIVDSCFLKARIYHWKSSLVHSQFFTILGLL